MVGRRAVRTERAKTSLLGKGFQARKGSDHDRFFLYVDGRKTRIHTKFSRGSKVREIPPSILDKIRRQLHLENIQEVVDLLLCPMNGARYLELLHQRGELENS